MKICIKPEQLRAALKDIEIAEKRGFTHSLAVFRLATIGHMLKDNTMNYCDIWDRAHPTDGSKDWGRQGASKTCRVSKKTGKLIPLRKIHPPEQIKGRNLQ